MGRVTSDTRSAVAPSASTDDVEAVLIERWYDLDQSDAEAVLAVVATLSDQELLDRPRLLASAVIARSIVADAEAGASGDRAEMLERFARVASAAHARKVAAQQPVTVELLVPLMIAARWRGDFNAAQQLSDRISALRHDPTAVDDDLRALVISASDRLTIDRPGHATVQQGITEILAADSERAMSLFSQAYHESGNPPFRHFAGVSAAANAAMLAAVEGHADAATTWLARVGDTAELPTWCRDLLTIGATIASTVMATDARDLGTARVYADRLSDAGDQFELWPFQVYALTQYDLARHEPVVAFERLKRIGFERGIDVTSVPIANHLVFRAYLDTLIDVAEGGLVLRLAEGAGEPLRSLIPVARTHQLAGDHRAAAQVSARALRRIRMPLRDMREASLIHAVARMRLGDAESALRSFTIATSGDAVSLPSLFSRQHAQDIADIHALAGIDYAAQHPCPERRSIEIISLTRRERAILQRLADGLSATEIAVEAFNSPNTIKTHIKRIYKKLGVSSRAEALAAADQQGLIRWHHPEDTRNAS